METVVRGMHRPDDAGSDLWRCLDGVIFASLIPSIVAGWIYYAYMESSPNQGTLGKNGDRTDRDGPAGATVDVCSSDGRYSAVAFSLKFIYGLISSRHRLHDGGINFKQKQALHDMIAGCLVLRKM